MRLRLTHLIMAVLCRGLRLIGIDVMYAAFYSTDVEKLENYIEEKVNANNQH